MRPGFDTRMTPPGATPPSPASLLGKTVVITGATSGIGRVAAEQLARMGARIVFIARDRQRGSDLVARLGAIAPGVAHAAHYADLSRFGDMARVAADIARSEPRIHVLANNAGALFNRRAVTVDGLERTFALNHMAYFVVTNLLLDRLKATPGARIVSTASDAHERATLDFEDLQCANKFSGFLAYGRSKLMNILMTRELARQLDGTGVTANCLHPGFVATRFADESGGPISVVVRVAKMIRGRSPERGAETLVWLASSPDVRDSTGGYYVDSTLTTPSAAARNAGDAARLWQISADLARRAGALHV